MFQTSLLIPHLFENVTRALLATDFTQQPLSISKLRWFMSKTYSKFFSQFLCRVLPYILQNKQRVLEKISPDFLWSNLTSVIIYLQRVFFIHPRSHKCYHLSQCLSHHYSDHNRCLYQHRVYYFDWVFLSLFSFYLF